MRLKLNNNYFSIKTHVVDTQKNRLNEKVPLRLQLMDKKTEYIFLRSTVFITI